MSAARPSARGAVGWLAARVVRGAARLSRGQARGLAELERRVLRQVFEASLDLERVRLVERVEGLVNASRRAFVIEDTVYIPAAYLPLAHRVLVHEATHLWQYQHGGHAYIASSLHAQTLGDGYDLLKGLREGRAWHELNCEQQAELIEEGYAQGALEGAPLWLNGYDFTPQLRAALAALRAGEGAPR